MVCTSCIGNVLSKKKSVLTAFNNRQAGNNPGIRCLAEFTVVRFMKIWVQGIGSKIKRLRTS